MYDVTILEIKPQNSFYFLIILLSSFKMVREEDSYIPAKNGSARKCNKASLLSTEEKRLCMIKVVRDGISKDSFSNAFATVRNKTCANK